MRTAARTLALALLVVVELAVARAYLVRGTAWHLALHTPIGFGLGLAAAALWSVLRRRPARAVPWAVAGQLVSVAPDLAFVFLRLPHRRWMDVFVGHITIHVVASPLGVAVAVFLLGGWAWWCAAWWQAPQARRALVGGGLAAATAAVLAGSLALAGPVPHTLEQVRPGPEGYADAALWWCS